MSCHVMNFLDVYELKFGAYRCTTLNDEAWKDTEVNGWITAICVYCIVQYHTIYNDYMMHDAS